MARIRIRWPENFPGSAASWQKLISFGSVSYLGNAVASHALESSRSKASNRSRIDAPYVRFDEILYHRRATCLINAVTGRVELCRKHLSGYATYQELRF